MPADGGTPERVTPFDINAGDGPEWSPDGDTLLFRTNADSEDGSGSQIATIRADGSGLRRFDPFGDKRPVRSSAWSPDGKWIVFAAEGKAGAFDLFVMTADGTQPRPLTRTPVPDSAPDWGGGGHEGGSCPSGRARLTSRWGERRRESVAGRIPVCGRSTSLSAEPGWPAGTAGSAIGRADVVEAARSMVCLTGPTLRRSTCRPVRESRE